MIFITLYELNCSRRKKNTNNRASNSRNRLKKKNSAEGKKFILIRGR